MFIFFILILIPALAFAQDPHDQLENKLFGDLDEDANGKITERENENKIMSFDADNDGVIAKAEFSASVDHLDPGFVGQEDSLYGLRLRDSNRHVDKTDIDFDFHLDDSNSGGVIDIPEVYVIFQLVIANVG